MNLEFIRENGLRSWVLKIVTKKVFYVEPGLQF